MIYKQESHHNISLVHAAKLLACNTDESLSLDSPMKKRERVMVKKHCDPFGSCVGGLTDEHDYFPDSAGSHSTSSQRVTKNSSDIDAGPEQDVGYSRQGSILA